MSPLRFPPHRRFASRRAKVPFLYRVPVVPLDRRVFGYWAGHGGLVAVANIGLGRLSQTLSHIDVIERQSVDEQQSHHQTEIARYRWRGNGNSII